MAPPGELLDLIQRFGRNLDDYRSGRYKETRLRRYARSAKLPVSVLTDFEELVVYECRKRPSRSVPRLRCLVRQGSPHQVRRISSLVAARHAEVRYPYVLVAVADKSDDRREVGA